MLKKTYPLVIAGCLLVMFTQGQDLRSMKGQKLVSFHGSIGAGANFYSSNEQYKTRDPFAWNLYGSFTPEFYGFALPFSFVITQYSKSYTSPFAQFGISPSYKWIKLHLGYRNISFSPLVFDGQSFLGAGIELHPKGFYFGAFYGRLNKAITEDTSYGHNLQPQYARIGYGVKIGVGGSLNNVSIQFFHARDDTASIHRIKDSLTSILPQENSVLGASWHFRFFKRLSFSGDVAASLLNRDLSYAKIDSIGYVKIPRLVQQLTPINYSSVISFSGQTQLLLTLNHLNASAGYRRIQPDFKSLGVPYALDDIEMISASLGTNLYKGRLSINAAYNTQHNNLAHMLSSELKTQTGNININSFISQHLNINVNLTGVQLYQQDGLLKLGDSIRMNQFMWNATFAPTLNFSGVLHQHTISFNINYTDLNDHNPLTASQTGCKSFSSSLSYSLFFTQSYWGINTNVMYSRYDQPADSYQSLGLNAGFNAQFLKEHNLAVQASIGYFLNHDDQGTAGNNTTFSFNCSYGMNKHHSLGLFASYVITPPVNLNPLNLVNHVPYAVNSKNLEGGMTYTYHF
jgi:hypothetical protein